MKPKYLVVLCISLVLIVGWLGRDLWLVRNAFKMQTMELLSERRTKAELDQRLLIQIAKNAHLVEAVNQSRDLVANTAKGNPAAENELDQWIGRIGKLKAYLARFPSKTIPEMNYLTMQDWLDATKKATLESEADYRKALANLRLSAKKNVAPKIAEALRIWSEASGGQLPVSASILSRYVSGDLDPSILQRYQINPSGTLPHVTIRGTDEKYVLLDGPNVDDIWDSTLFFGTHGGVGIQQIGQQQEMQVLDAISQYISATGALPTDAQQVAKFMKVSMPPDKLNLLFSAVSSSSSSSSVPLNRGH